MDDPAKLADPNELFDIDTHIDDMQVVFGEHPDLDDDNDPQSGAELVYERDNGYTQALVLQFTSPGTTEMEDHPFGIANIGNTVLYKTAHTEVAVALFAVALELFDESTKEDLKETLSENEFGASAYKKYVEWHEDLTMRERQLRLLDIAESKAEGGNGVISEHLDTGSFRGDGEIPDGGDTGKLADEVFKSSEGHRKTQKCYQNAINTYADWIDNGRVRYCEGVVFLKQGASVYPHAWLEVDGYPVELSYSWHTPNPYPAVYFGSAVSDKDVIETVNKAQTQNRKLDVPISVSESARESLRNTDIMKQVNDASS